MEKVFGRTLLFRRCAFSDDGRISFVFCDGDEIIDVVPKFGETFTLRFDVSQRFCTGWHDIIENVPFVCPDSTLVEKHDICIKCRNQTGFNPAFYNVDTVSDAQNQRNHQPHALYLAYFGGDFVKVGIAHESRKLGRLLEQGARFATVLDTFPTANVARKYEAQIVKMDGIVEAVRVAPKEKLLAKMIDPNAAKNILLGAIGEIQNKIGINFSQPEIVNLDEYYSNEAIPTNGVPFPNAETISGEYIAQIGTITMFRQQSENLFANLKILNGYKVYVKNELTQVELPPRQTALF